ncbi:MAG: L-histidine N(alpha)-methyltransferase [Balneolaceae bacterium]|nr:L-histidine N(alpha)-methyltransferase [Balneolaceae bacterium]
MNSELATQDKQLQREITAGLKKSQKELPAKYFYDERGSRLFEQITRLEEYYLTETEMHILREKKGAITGHIGDGAVLLELGSGSSKKTRMLLDHMNHLVAYIPVDISEDYLLSVADSLRKEYPEIIIKPVCADYTRPFQLPEIEESYNRKVAFYPGSTIGNFIPETARSFLKQIASILGPGGGLLIGVDLKKERSVLEAAYNDAEGVTAEFNKNILRRLNRELKADFKLDQFEHQAFYNEQEGRIEMHLECKKEQTVHINGEAISFERGETIHTENSYKYSLDEFEELLSGIFTVESVWTDDQERFSLQFLTSNHGQ